MKRIFLSIGLAALSCMAYAHQVDEQTAQTVAVNFMKGRVLHNATYHLITTYPASNAKTAMYIFDINNGKGFVVVSGDDAVKPVLGYSSENPFPAAVSNKEVAYWLDNYGKQISYVISHPYPASDATVAMWNKLKIATGNKGDNTAQKVTGVAPLVTTLWDQEDPDGNGTDNNLYNTFCPTATPTGCVATAMAQIMNFWQNPITGIGSHSYSTSATGGTLFADFGVTSYGWVNMPQQLTSTSTMAEKNAVGTLMFHCGVSVDMNYSNGGSGAYVISSTSPVPACSQSALLNYFSYKSTMQGNLREDYSDSLWIKKLRFEIDNSRPILYFGSGTLGGHAFVFDGYDDNNFFHINWGWSGLANGYYSIDNLTPTILGVGAGNGNFNNGQGALLMIEPISSTLPPNPVTPDYPHLVGNFSLVAPLVQSNDTIVYNTPFALEGKMKNIDTDTFKNGYLSVFAVDNNNSSNYYLLDQRMVTVAPGAVYDYNFSSNGIPSLIPSTYDIGFIFNTATSIFNSWSVGDSLWNNDARLTVVPAKPTGISNIGLDTHFDIYPNPANSMIHVKWNDFKGTVKGIQLYNVIGQNVRSLNTVSGNSCNIQIDGLSAGIYTLRIITDQGNISKEITIAK